MKPIVSINEFGIYDSPYEVKFYSRNGLKIICEVTASINEEDEVINLFRVKEGNSAINWLKEDIRIFQHYLDRKDIDLYYNPENDERAIRIYPVMKAY